MHRRTLPALLAPLASLALLGGLLAAPRFATAASANAGADAKAGCTDLRQLGLRDVRITAATGITPAGGWLPDRVWTAELGDSGGAVVRVPFCRVEGLIEKEIGFELWLPAPASWNGKFLGAGVGGDAGLFNLRDLPRGVERGYAAGTTDTGHKASDPAWMLGDPERLPNYLHRANHLLVTTARQIIAAYYARGPSHSYFIGCSGGGHQGLKEMQRYPEDYDGIIAGAPGPRTDIMSTRRLFEIILNRQTKSVMPDSAWQRVAEAGAAACDTRDGVRDGVAEDPSRCRFDPAALQCRGAGQPGGAGAASCLTPAQVDIARRMYAPVRDENGKVVTDGLLPGVRVITTPESKLAPALFGQLVHRDANWDLERFRIVDDLPALNRLTPDFPVDDPDLRAFRDRGGKALLYQGWMDPFVPAQMTIAYAEAVQKKMGGPRRTDDFFRLFMAPGVFHCRDGPGPDRFGGSGEDAPVPDADHDLLSALERWVEKGQAPERIVAAKLTDGGVVRTRPLCVYPATARYLGKGSTDDAANFACSARPQ